MTRLADGLFFLVCLVSSMDIFGSFTFSGYNIRLVYVFMLLMVVLAILHAARNHGIKGRMAGAVPFFVWTVFLAVFTVASPLFIRSFLYLAWLGLSASFVYAASEFSTREDRFQHLVKLWLSASVLISCFGILQFVLGLGGTELLITQRWRPRLVRVNGFCYEPSFFLTYLAGPWSVLTVLFIKRKGSTFRFPLGPGLVLVTAAMLLSSSRLGIFYMSVVVAVFCLAEVIRMIRTRFRDLQWRRLLILGTSLVLFAGLAVFVTSNWDGVKFLFKGTGLGNTEDSSLTIRTGAQGLLVDSILDNPWTGLGLGGAPVAIAGRQGIHLDNQQDAKPFEASNVFLEIIIASGLPGALFFFTFLFMLAGHLVYSWRNRKISGRDESIRLGMLLGLAMTFALLFANQNILRPYVWVLIGLANASIFASAAAGREEPGK